MLVKKKNFEKRASLAGLAAWAAHHAGLGFAGHVAQNGLVHFLTKNSTGFHKDFLGNFIYGKDINSGSDAFFQGMRSALTPEARVLCLEAREYRKTFDEICKRLGWNPDWLTKKQLAVIRRVLRGDFRKAARMSENGRKVVSELVSMFGDDAMLPKKLSNEVRLRTGKRPFELLNDAIEESPELMEELEAAWKENPYLGNLGRGLAKQLNSKTFQELALKNDALKRRSWQEAMDDTTRVHNAGEVGLSAALGYFEPFTALFNLKKRALTTKSTREFMESDIPEESGSWFKRKLQKALHELKYWTTDRPMLAAAHKGAQGLENVPDFLAESAKDSQGVKNLVNGARMYCGNMPLASINEFNNRVMLALHKFNKKTANTPLLERFVIDPELQKAVKDKAKALDAEIGSNLYRMHYGNGADLSLKALPSETKGHVREELPLWDPRRLVEYEME